MSQTFMDKSRLIHHYPSIAYLTLSDVLWHLSLTPFLHFSRFPCNFRYFKDLSAERNIGASQQIDRSR